MQRNFCREIVAEKLLPRNFCREISAAHCEQTEIYTENITLTSHTNVWAVNIYNMWKYWSQMCFLRASQIKFLFHKLFFKLLYSFGTFYFVLYVRFILFYVLKERTTVKILPVRMVEAVMILAICTCANVTVDSTAETVRMKSKLFNHLQLNKNVKLQLSQRSLRKYKFPLLSMKLVNQKSTIVQMVLVRTEASAAI